MNPVLLRARINASLEKKRLRDQELEYLGPAEYGAWIREQYAKEKLVVERMGLSRGGS